ncbi:hypothetical protein PSTT_09531 [Puccinia striiformis]|uniref:Uncharacterized protein n=1 Tax=Puccinia striiformis TaxID=27350 RepID=A0A2S4V898_9BASI|nr:hypothetical protein PSTT_09531 [Puccinia striiformis]
MITQLAGFEILRGRQSIAIGRQILSIASSARSLRHTNCLQCHVSRENYITIPSGIDRDELYAKGCKLI